MPIIVFLFIAVLAVWALVKFSGSSPDTEFSAPGAYKAVEDGRGMETEMPGGTTMTLRLPGGAKMEMVWCPPGTFMMGSPENESGHCSCEPLHQVTLTEGFWMAKHAVTQKQWKSVMRGNPSHFKGNALPVEHVSWFDCAKFCKKAGLSLPTEAQWEYACRAGSEGPYAGTGNLDEMAWHCDNEGCNSTHPGGGKVPNAWGLCDMHGNVQEWCRDVWDEKKPGGVMFDPESADPYAQCVIRGGSVYSLFKEDCRSASRDGERPDFREEPFGAPIQLIGFRPIARQDRSGERA